MYCDPYAPYLLQLRFLRLLIFARLRGLPVQLLGCELCPLVSQSCFDVKGGRYDAPSS